MQSQISDQDFIGPISYGETCNKPVRTLLLQRVHIFFLHLKRVCFSNCVSRDRRSVWMKINQNMNNCNNFDVKRQSSFTSTLKQECYIQVTTHCCPNSLLASHTFGVVTVRTSITLARAIMLSVLYTQGPPPPSALSAAQWPGRYL